jgi:cell division protein ZapA
MPLVNVMVNSRDYAIACEEGQEEHLKELAAHVDAKVGELAASVGQVGDGKLLLMAALVVADELFEARTRAAGNARSAGDLAQLREGLDARLAEAQERASAAIREAETRAAETEQRAAQTLDEVTGRIERIVAKLKAA